MEQRGPELDHNLATAEQIRIAQAAGEAGWCGTCREEGFTRAAYSGPLAQIGFHSEIPLWNRRSKVHFGIEKSFPSHDMELAVWHLYEKAAAAWNFYLAKHTGDLDGIFSGSESAREVNAVIGYRPGADYIAQAFLPNDKQDNRLLVSRQFFSYESEILRGNFLMYELGHVLGLRHEFAVDREGEGAVVPNGRDPASIMSYDFNHFRLTEKDREALGIIYGSNFTSFAGRSVHRYDPKSYKH